MIRDFKEKEIRNRILSKVQPQIKFSSRSPHQKGYIYYKGKVIGKVKLPNDHERVMHGNKSQYIARALKLDDNQFNALIDCLLTGPKYFEIIEPQV